MDSLYDDDDDDDVPKEKESSKKAVSRSTRLNGFGGDGHVWMGDE